MKRTPQIGFTRHIMLEWLEQTTRLLLAGESPDEIRAYLHDFLRDQLSAGSRPAHGSRGKAITVLFSTWITLPLELVPFRDDGLALLRRLPREQHLPVHWGMTAAAYPFFGAVADVIGRLLRLQGSVATTQVHQRIRQQYGDRDTISKAVSQSLQSLQSWNVLLPAGTRNVYQAAPPVAITDPEMTGWLVEAALRSAGAHMFPVRTVPQLPIHFPFVLSPTNVYQIQNSKRIELLRQGLDEDLIALRETAS